MSTPYDVSGTMTAPPSDDPDHLRRQIANTREDLGETVSALSERADVKAQASARAEEVKQRAQEAGDTAKTKAQENPIPLMAVGAVLLLLVLRKMRKRRRASRLENRVLDKMPVTAMIVDRSELAAS